MARATWNGATLAESDDFVIIEGNCYFPREAIRWKFFAPSRSHTTCHWKGIASYYDIVVDGQVNQDAAWYYPEPSEAAKSIKDRVAFWSGVEVDC